MKIIIAFLFLCSFLFSSESSNITAITKFNSAIHFINIGNEKKAIELLNQIETKNPQLAIKILFYKNIIINKNDAPLLREEFLHITKLIPKSKKSFDSIYFFGFSKLKLFELSKNEKFLKEALDYLGDTELKNLSNDTRLIFAQIYVHSGYYKKALDVYITTHQPDHKKLAILFTMNDNIIEAKKELLLIQNPDAEAKLLLLHTFIKLNNIKEIENLITLNDKDTDFINTLKKHPFSLFTNKDSLSYKTSQKKLLELIQFNNNNHLDFILAHAQLLTKENESSILNEDILLSVDHNKAFTLANISNQTTNFLLSINNLDSFSKAKVFKEYISKIDTPKSNDYYNLGIITSQSQDYPTAYKMFLKSFFLDQKNVLAGTFALLLSKYKLHNILNDADEKSIRTAVMNSNTNEASKIAKFILNFFTGEHKTTSLSKIGLDDPFSKFSFNYLKFIATKEKKYLNNLETISPLSKLLYTVLIYNNNGRYPLTSYLQDNLPSLIALETNEPSIFGELLVTIYHATGNIKKINNYKINQIDKMSYLRNYAIAQCLNNNFTLAGSIFDLIDSSNHTLDETSFIMNLVSAIETKQKNKVKILASSGRNRFSTPEMRLIDAISYLNLLEFDTFVSIIKKGTSEKTISIKIENLDQFIQ